MEEAPALTPQEAVGRAAAVAGGLVLASFVFAVVGFSLLGEAARGRPAVLVMLVAQQLIVVAGGSAMAARVLTISASRVFSGTSGGSLLWAGSALSGAAGFAILQSPIVDAWAGFIRATPPDWWSEVVDISGLGAAALTFGAIALVPALCEELCFRGVFWRILEPAGAAWTLCIQAVLFALFHQDPYGLPIYLVAGLLLGALRLVSGSIWPGVLAHLTNNILGTIEIARGESLYGLLGSEAWLVGGGLSALAVCCASWLSRRR